MMQTPLHIVLGETNSPITFSMLERAVELEVEETDSLDWKRDLPLPTDPDVPQKQKENARYELAKDIAAMANSGGGMIVYGVGEKTTDGRTVAGSLTTGLNVSSDDEKRIHQVAFSSVQPPVVGLELRSLSPKDRPEDSVLVLKIPDSLDAPHLVVAKGDGGYFQAPWRSGPETFFMSERQLADAYRRREQSRREQVAELDDLHDRFLSAIGGRQDTPIWIFAVARPVQPYKDPRAMGALGAGGILKRAANIQWSGQTLRETVTQATTRRGLRMFYWHFTRELRDRQLEFRVEVHGDGSIALGKTRDGLFHPEDIDPRSIAADDIEDVGLGLLALMLAVRQARGPRGDYEICIDISSESASFRHRDSLMNGHYQAANLNVRNPKFRPVRGTVVGHLDRTELLNSASEIIDDAMSQAGAFMAHSAGQLETALRLME